MKVFTQCLYVISFVICFNLLAIKSWSQMISFKNNDATQWADGIAQDGDGGSADIAGITLQLYATTTAYTPLLSTIEWNDNDWYYSGDATFNGIKPVPVNSEQGEVPAFVIKSADPKINFSLASILIYDWGGSDGQRVEAFNNGISKGFINLSFDQESWWPLTLSQPTVLPAGIFSNIDEVRITAQNVTAGMYPAINNIMIGSILPIHFISFNGKLVSGNSALLEWKVDGISGDENMEVEQSHDGENFFKSGSVAAIKNTGTYHFKTKPISKSSFFRIKQTEKNGNCSYSKIISLNPHGIKTSVNIFPNPTEHFLTVASSETIKECVIRNAAGAIVMKITSQDAFGKIDVSLLKSGNYFISIDTGSQTLVKPFIKK